MKEEELKPETKPSSRTADLGPEFAVEEDLKPETKPAQQIRSEQDAEEDLVPETRPVERRDLTDGEDEELVPQTKPVQRSSELKPETKPSPSQVSAYTSQQLCGSCFDLMYCIKIISVRSSTDTRRIRAAQEKGRIVILVGCMGEV